MSELILVIALVVLDQTCVWEQDDVNLRFGVAGVSGENLLNGKSLVGGTECLRFLSITTSEISVQVYTHGSWVGEVIPADKADVTVQHRGEVVASRQS